MLSVTFRLISCCGIALLTVFHLGCSDERPTGPALLNEDRFPLAIGNQWVYQAETELRIDGQVIPTSRLKATWEITGREVVLGTEAYQMEVTHLFVSGPDSGRSATAKRWYTMKDDTLRAVAFQGRGLDQVAQLHKPVVLGRDEITAWHFNILVFPLEIGDQWDTGNILVSDVLESDQKQVNQIEDVSVPAGQYKAFKITRNAQTPSGQLISNQWFSSVGLIKMDYVFESVINRTDERGNETGQSYLSTAKVDMVLESYSIEASGNQ